MASIVRTLVRAPAATGDSGHICTPRVAQRGGGPDAGFMPELVVTVPVAAPAAQVFAALTDWDTQGEWMLGTRVTGVGPQRRASGDRLEAFTGVGPLGFLDTMVVSDWVDGVEVTVDHTGRVVRGSGTFRVEPDGPDRSMVVWIENLSIPGGAVGRFLWRASRPVSKWAVTHSLRRFAAQVESRSPDAAAA